MLHGTSITKVWKLKFNCIDEAKAFYDIYARVTVFSIQKDDLKRNKNEEIISRNWVCYKERHWLPKCFKNENLQGSQDHLLDWVMNLHFVLDLVENWKSGLLKSLRGP